MTRRPTHGLSLVELAIYSAIMMALLGSLYLLLVAATRYLRTGDVYQRVLQEGAVAIRKMSFELSNSNVETVDPSLTLPGPALLFMSADPPFPGVQGEWAYVGPDLQWQKWVCYFRDSTDNSLVRVEEELAAPTPLPPVPASPGWAYMRTLGPPLRTVLARGITGLVFDVDVDRVSLEVTARESTGSGTNQHTDVTLTTEVRMENQTQP